MTTFRLMTSRDISIDKNSISNYIIKNNIQCHQSISIAVELIFHNSVNNCKFFSNFRYGFRSPQSTADLLRVVSDKLLGLLTGLGILKLKHLIYTGFLTLWSNGLVVKALDF